MSSHRVTVFTSERCSLCCDALDVLLEAQEETAFELEIVNIDGDPKLEKRFRAWLPVVDIDGHRAFTFSVDPGALRERLRQAAGVPRRD